ncbi:MAG: prolipoprotein diacylglyceryl transferase [Lachnospiraceae bacterium]|nr:prolipoprotein diacylglyceryl transferase [Lachnospiraceae bacterium]
MVIKLFGERLVSVYGLLGVGGFVLGIAVLAIVCRVKKVSFDDVIYVYVWAGIMAIVGAKALYLLLDIQNIMAAFQKGGNYLTSYLKAIFGGGLVFYGGLGGGMLGVFLACRYFKLDFRAILATAIPTLPLAHAFGRLGCHTVGCCYGVPVRGHFGKMYTNSMFAPNNVLLFPVQLTESICDFLIFGILIFLLVKTPTEKLKKSNLPEIYLIMYSVVRFVLEFFRGDAVRGHFLIFSTSQWISIVILIAAGISCVVRTKQKRKTI